MVELYNEDCSLTIDRLKNKGKMVDCIITSPPYNVDLGKTSKSQYNTYDDNKKHLDYINWLGDIFDSCYDILEEGGRLCINIGDSKNGEIPTHSDIIQKLVREGRYIMNSVIMWNKNHTNSRTCWGSWLSPSCPSYPTTLEYILIFSKGTKKLQNVSKSSVTDLTKEEFTKWAFGMWTFAPEKGAQKIGHPAPFPVEMPKRLIKMNTYPGMTIYDPFLGSGTTGLSASILNRDFIGSEIDEKYFNIAKNRIGLVLDEWVI